MLAININDTNIEKRCQDYAKEHKQSLETIAKDAITSWLDKLKNNNRFEYTTKDPTKYTRNISSDRDEFLCDETALMHIKPYSHIDDSAKYIHDLRRARHG